MCWWLCWRGTHIIVRGCVRGRMLFGIFGLRWVQLGFSSVMVIIEKLKRFKYGTSLAQSKITYLIGDAHFRCSKAKYFVGCLLCWYNICSWSRKILRRCSLRRNIHQKLLRRIAYFAKESHPSLETVLAMKCKTVAVSLCGSIGIIWHTTSKNKVDKVKSPVCQSSRCIPMAICPQQNKQHIQRHSERPRVQHIQEKCWFGSWNDNEQCTRHWGQWCSGEA